MYHYLICLCALYIPVSVALNMYSRYTRAKSLWNIFLSLLSCSVYYLLSAFVLLRDEMRIYLA